MANKRKLSSICKQVRGVSYTPLDVTETPTHGYIPILRANNIQNDIVFDDLVYVNRKRISSEQKLQEGDILVCASSGSKNLVGKAAMFRDFTIPEVSFGAFCKVVRPTKVFAPYLAHFFNSSYYRNTISQIAQGANINNIRNEHLGNLDVPLPEESEQKKIAERLDNVQELIALQKEQLKKLDDLIKSRFIALFGDPITNPKGWTLKRMGDLYYLKAGQTTKANVIHPYSEDYSVPCYGGNGIRGYVQTSTYEGIFPIIGRQGALCGNIQLASGKFHATEHAVLVTPLKGDQPLYVYHLLKDMNLYRFHGGAAQPGLAVKTLNEINIIDVPHNLQTQFTDFVAKIETQKGLLTTRLSHLETLYKSLMQEYFDASDKNKEL